MNAYLWLQKGNPMNDYPTSSNVLQRAEPEQNLFAAVRALAVMSSNLRARLEAIHSAFTGDVQSRGDSATGEAPCLDGAFPSALRHVQYVRDDLTAIGHLADRLEALLPKE